MHFGVVILEIIGAAMLLSGIRATSKQGKLFLASVILAFGIVGLNCLLLFYPNTDLILLSNACIVILLTLFTISILGGVLRAGSVDTDKIYGALCVYLLIGYAWAFGYAILDQVQPGAFVIPDGPMTAPDHVERVMRMRYFSFVTLTTVGFGDITPRSAAARTLATLEAIMGQIYLAVLVARLVGLHIVHGSKSDDA